MSLFSFLRAKMPRKDAVIVVSGLPRSGTSLVMSMLGAGGVEIMTDGVRSSDEDNPKGYFEFERVKDLDKGGDKSWLADARGKAVKIISFLLKDLPDDPRYKVVMVARDLDEVLASQEKMLIRRGEATDESDRGRMKSHYEGHLKKVARLLAARKNMESIEVAYAEILENPRSIARRLRTFLGAELDVEKMARQVDPSLYRNRNRPLPDRGRG